MKAACEKSKGHFDLMIGDVWYATTTTTFTKCQHNALEDQRLKIAICFCYGSPRPAPKNENVAWMKTTHTPPKSSAHFDHLKTMGEIHPLKYLVWAHRAHTSSAFDIDKFIFL